MELPSYVKPTHDPQHAQLLGLAYKTAWKDSHDLRTKNGAVLSQHSSNGLEVVAAQANRVPADVREQYSAQEFVQKLSDREWKYANIIHAEPGAIAAAKEAGRDAQGLIMHMPWVPCKPCGEHVHESGISQLVMHKQLIARTPSRWHKSTKQGLAHLHEHGVHLVAYDGTIGDVYSLFDNVLWKP